MHAKNKILGLLTAFIFICLFVSTGIINAVGTQISLGSAYIADDHDSVTRPQIRTLTHTNGDTVIVSMDSATSISALRVKVVSPSGSILSSVNIAGLSGTAIEGGESLIQLNSTSVLIAVGSIYYYSSTQHAEFYLIPYNIVTGSYRLINGQLGSSGTNYIGKIGQLFTYNNIFYCPFVYNGVSLYMAKFVVSTRTLTLNNLSQSVNDGEIMGFESGGIIYMMCSTGSTDSTQYAYSCTSGLIANLISSNNNFDYPSQDAYDNIVTYIGGGLVTNGIYHYLYQMWCYSTLSGEGVSEVITNMWIGKFNATISATTNKASIEKSYTATDSSGSISLSPNLNWGWYHASSSTAITIYSYYFDAYASKLISRVTLATSNITLLTNNFDSIIILKGVDNEDFNFYTGNGNTVGNIAKDPNLPMTYEEVDNTHSYIWVGGNSTPTTNYSATLSYTPQDNPLVIGKYYIFTYTISNNGVVSNSLQYYSIYVNGIDMMDGNTSNGIITFTPSFSIIGSYGYQLFVYTGSTLVYTGTQYNYNVVTGSTSNGNGNNNGGNGGSTSNTTIGSQLGNIASGYYNLAVIWIPLGLFVLVPMIGLALLCAKYAGATGALLGLIFGGFVGVIGGTQLNIIPQYFLYLYIFLIGIGLVIIIRGQSSNG